MSLFNNSIMMGASAAGAYEIERSLRFDAHGGSTNGTTLTRTPSSAGNRKTWTFSAWVKRGPYAVDSAIFNAGGGGSPNTTIRFDGDDALHCFEYNSGWTYRLDTDRRFRDPSAWYHIVVTLDTTQGTADNRIKMYVNGVQETSFDNRINPAQDTDYTLNNNIEHTIGNNAVTTVNANYYNGYMAEVHFVDGTALDASSFGKTNPETGQWIPKKYGGSHGTNGFYLNFSDNSNTTSSTLGDDDSANTNDWTPNNFSVATTFAGDSMPDTPTNNLCTINPIYNGHNNISTFTQGLLHVNTANVAATSLASIAIPQTGKWFCEVKMTDLNSEGSSTGWIGVQTSQVVASPGQPRTAYYGYTGNKYVRNDSSDTNSAYGDSYGLNDVIGVAVNMDDDEITFYKNGTSQGTISSWKAAGVDYFFMVGDGGSAGSTEYELNFGQKDFLYTKPTGYEILSVNNLPEPTIKKGTDNFDTVLYTGTGSSRSITSLDFSPDFVWFKERGGTSNGMVFDTVRGTEASLWTSGTWAEDSYSGEGISAFLSNGWTIGTSNNANTNNDSYVAWNWKGGSSNVSNSDGNITSTVNVNATAGFSIVGWTGNGTDGQTVGHGLGVTPDCIIIKKRANNSGGNTGYWIVQHAGLSNGPIATSSVFTLSGYTNGTLYLNDTATQSSYVFDNQVNGNTDTFIAYCFSGVEGYSKFGSYIGNGNADGTFVYTGFRPAYFMIKRLATESWVVVDSTRDPDNPVAEYILADTNAAAASGVAYDFVSNGIKFRGTSQNESGSTYVYLAFAERPFKYANAR